MYTILVICILVVYILLYLLTNIFPNLKILRYIAGLFIFILIVITSIIGFSVKGDSDAMQLFFWCILITIGVVIHFVVSYCYYGRKMGSNSVGDSWCKIFCIFDTQGTCNKPNPLVRYNNNYSNLPNANRTQKIINQRARNTRDATTQSNTWQISVK